MKTKELELRIDTGFITVPIKDAVDGEVMGEFKFNPSDLGYLKRYDTFAEEMGKITIPDESDMDAVFEATEQVKKYLGYFLNCNVDSIFTINEPFSPVSDGDLYVEKVIDGIVTLVEQVTEQRIEKKRTKIKKATAKYAKGGMKAAVNAARR